MAFCDEKQIFRASTTCCSPYDLNVLPLKIRKFANISTAFNKFNVSSHVICYLKIKDIRGRHIRTYGNFLPWFLLPLFLLLFCKQNSVGGHFKVFWDGKSFILCWWHKNMLSSNTFFCQCKSGKESKQMKIDNKCKYFEIQFMRTDCVKNQIAFRVTHTRVLMMTRMQVRQINSW